MNNKRPQPRLNKVTRTLLFMNNPPNANIPRTAREMFVAQKSAIESIANPEFYRQYDEILAQHNFTRDQYPEMIHDPELYTFYSHGLEPDQIPVNDAIAKYCRSQGMFNADYLFTTFTAHLHNAYSRGQIARQGKRGAYKYKLPKAPK